MINAASCFLPAAFPWLQESICVALGCFGARAGSQNFCVMASSELAAEVPARTGIQRKEKTTGTRGKFQRSITSCYYNADWPLSVDIGWTSGLGAKRPAAKPAGSRFASPKRSIMLDRPFMTTQLTFFALLAAWLGVLFGTVYIPAPAHLRVFAAASLKDGIHDANLRYQRVTGHQVVVSYGASDTLAQQIDYGASADIFISADGDWMDYLADRNLIKPETRLNFLGNKLVLIASAGSAPTLAIGPNFPLAQALGNGRLAIADPAAVPAGKYGKAALEALGVWASVKSRVALAQDVRNALELVRRREAPLGIVYQTDALADRSVNVVGTFPASSHPPITYPLAVIAASTNPAAESYIAFLQSPEAKAAFSLPGFVLLR